MKDNEQIADAISSIASALHSLGTGDAGSTMGAIEYLATEVRDGARAIADALDGITDAIRYLAARDGKEF